ncbi:MAG: hypothetical protein WCF57_21280 [Pyrinomonadaceae bacterium]
MKTLNISDIRFYQTPGTRLLPTGATVSLNPESEKQPARAFDPANTRVIYP